MTNTEIPHIEGRTKPKLSRVGYSGALLFGLLLGVWVLRYSGFAPVVNECETTGRLVKAGADDFIWIIVGVFWIIAQIAGGAAKKNKLRRPPPVPGESPEPAGDPLTELLRKLSSGQSFEAPEADFEELTEEPESAANDPWIPEKPPVLVGFQHQSAPVPVPVPVPKPIEMAKPVEIETPSKTTEIDIRPTMKAFRNASTAMKQPSMNLRIQGLEKRSGTVSCMENLINPADKRSLRRAMLSHIIFSPPKALEGMK